MNQIELEAYILKLFPNLTAEERKCLEEDQRIDDAIKQYQLRYTNFKYNSNYDESIDGYQINKYVAPSWQSNDLDSPEERY